MNLTIKSGDNVLVITGKDKGKTGKVLKVFANDNKVLVDNVNIVAKHQKPKSQQDKGGIIRKSAPIEASNVLVVCPVCNKATRVSHKEIDGKKVRVCKKCGASLDKEFVKQTKREAKKTIKASELKGATLKAATKEKTEEDTSTAKKTTKSTKSVEKTAEKKTTTKKSTENKETK